VTAADEAAGRLRALCEYFETYGEWPGNRSDSNDVADLRAVLDEREQLAAANVRAETAEAQVARQRELNRQLARDCLRAMTRATAAEDVRDRLQARLDEMTAPNQSRSRNYEPGDQWGVRGRNATGFGAGVYAFDGGVSGREQAYAYVRRYPYLEVVRRLEAERGDPTAWRTVDGPEFATGGVVPAGAGPVLGESGCTYVLPSQAEIEAQAAAANELKESS
jgi:hypothetical protein